MRKYVYSFNNEDTVIKLALENHIELSKQDFIDENKDIKGLQNCTDFSFVEDIDFNKRYYLFGGASYYPRGGFEDLLLTSNRISDFINVIKNKVFTEHIALSLDNLDWIQIIDKKLNTIVLNKNIESSRCSKEALESISKEINKEIFVESLKEDILI